LEVKEIVMATSIVIMAILFGICTVGALVCAILLWNESRKTVERR